MTATTPANLPALVWRQWDREDDCFHALAWAEWLEEHGHPDRGELVRLEFEEQNSDCDCERGKLIRELRAKLSAWPCRNGQYKCGKGRWAKTDGGYDSEWVPHEPCGGTGDVLKAATVNGGDVYGNLPLEWDCGFPRWVTLPTIDECVRLETLGGGPIRVGMGYRPTPRLRALAQTPPWGVPLEGVRVADREPYWNGGGYCWFDADRTNPSELTPADAGIPSPAFKLLSGWQTNKSTGTRWKPYPTGQAAADALARGLVKFAREYEG
ncbi:MAG TPA: hypothetical protein VM529_18395 [Gemmata sp.]|nr:hypothetical protein [Gemmata sp.]